MSEMSFGADAEARRWIGNVFLAFAEVKRAVSESRRSRETFPIRYGNRLPSIQGNISRLKSIFTFPVS
jgi:hypothetical protein